MTSSTLNPWIRTNKYLLIVFTLLLLITIPLAIFTLSTSSPAVSPDTNMFLQPSARVKQLLKSVSHGTMSEDKYDAFSKQVAKDALATDFVEIANCSLSPVIINAKINSTLQFHNSGNQLHYLTLSNQKPIRVEPLGSVNVPLTFIKSTPSISGIGCDSHREAVGILYVTAQ